MADSDYDFEDEVSDDDYIGNKGSASNTRAQSTAATKRRKVEIPVKEAPQRKAWETEYSRTVEKTIQPADDGSLGQSVQEREEERKRKRLRKDTKPFQRGIIRHVVLVLDLSEAMLEKDMRPNRFITMINYTQDYIREFFEQNPISQMSVLGMHDGVCIRVSELSGNPAEHVAAIQGLRSKDDGKEPKGSPSLQNALELARATLYHTPNHGTREVIVVFGSLLSLDPGDIHQSVKACVRDRIRVSIIGMGARLKICTEIVKRTNAGDESEYTIATDQEMLRELLQATTTPPVIRQPLLTDKTAPVTTTQSSESAAALMMMGFPSRVVEDQLTMCACHGNLTMGGYTCSRCSAKVCSLPITCPSCQLTLLLSTHLARSYHDLTKFPPSATSTTANMADADYDPEAAAALKAKRAFRKFSYRGVDLDQLLDLGSEELRDLVHARARRRFNRGLKRKPMGLIKKLRKSKQEARPNEKPDLVKTHLRDMIVVPEMIGSVIGVYSGKEFNQVEIKPEMVGHYLAEFSISYRPVKHGRPGIGATHSSRFIPLK